MHNAYFEHLVILLEYLGGCSIRAIDTFSVPARSSIYRGMAYNVHLKPAFSALYIFIAPYLPFRPSYIVCLPKKYF